jgi:NACalpha-BTF3-like transcription factor
MKKKVIVLQLDPYTRIVLTVIALCLAGMLLKPLFAVLPAVAQSKELKKEIQDVNIALINGQPPEVAVPLRVNVARAKTIGVKIEEAPTLSVAIEKSATVPVNIEKPDVLTVNIAKSETLPVSIAAPDVLDARVVDSITMPVEITAPFPVPVIQTVKRARYSAPEEP